MTSMASSLGAPSICHRVAAASVATRPRYRLHQRLSSSPSQRLMTSPSCLAKNASSGMPRDTDVALEAEAEREGAVGAADATPSNRTRPSTRTRRGVLTLAATGLFAATTVTAFDVEMAQAVASAPAGVDTPQARDALRAALVENIVQTKAPAVLRLVFHDSGTYGQATGDGGMNGSVRFELTRPESFGLKRGLG